MMTPEERATFEKYFPALTDVQWRQLEQLPELYQEWNAKINVISRKDIEHVMCHHVLHSLAIALFTRFESGTSIIDVGTGGGFPGLPLAILYPDCRFVLVDSIGKKVRVAESIGGTIGLSNVVYRHARAEELKERGHFIVSRAAMSASSLMQIADKLLLKKEHLNALPNGVIALKGGDLTEELKPFRKIATTEDIFCYMPDVDFFESKKIVYIPV